MKKKLFRDESTPDRKEIWAKVEQAASRVDAAAALDQPTSENRTYRHDDARRETRPENANDGLEA